MLKLTEIELLGFKSFADRTRLVCDGNTVAVVGPNGCGKSNLADAVSWVLGEQSARLLRGERMLDVIFNGTGTRPPTGMAEASITLVNAEDNGAPSPQPSPLEPAGASDASKSDGSMGAPSAVLTGAGREIKVTRRLFRSGESEYLLNGQLCRLRDIQDIFMGTGLGPESYAIIEQGRIGQILSSKPSDRRAIIEEAAGISKFKSRKRLAEAKLESSRQNLSRIHDILEEITKQSNSLKRQAAKAGRYRELREELGAQQKRVFSSRLRALDAECSRLRQELDSFQAEHSAASALAGELENAMRSAADRHQALEDELGRLREALAQRELESERSRSRLEQARQRAAALELRLAEAGQEHEHWARRAAELTLQAQEKRSQAQNVYAESVAARESSAKAAARQAQIATELSAGEAEMEASRRRILAAASTASELGNRLAKAEEMSAALDRQAARSAAEYSSLEEECRRASAALARAQAEHASAEAESAELARALTETDAAVAEAAAEEAELRAQVEALRQEFSQASARKQALEESLARHAYSTESVRMLLARPSNGNGFHPLGLLADFLEVAPGYEEAVEEFLKAELDSVVVKQHEEARSGIALLDREGGGRSTFFVRDVHTNGHGATHPEPRQARQEAGVLASIAELVRFEPRLGLNGDAPFPVLERSFVVEQASDAERLAGIYPSCHFVTRRGEHYHHRLVAGGKTSSAGPLALRRDFRELERRAAESQAALEAAGAAWAEARAGAARAQEDRGRLAAECVSAEKRSILAAEKLRQAQESARQAQERLGTLERDSAALAAEREKAVNQQAACRAELDAIRNEQEQLEQQLRSGADRVRSLRADYEDASRALTEAQVRLSALEERWNAAQAEAARAASEADDARERLTGLEIQTASWAGEKARLEPEAESEAAALEAGAAAQQILREEIRVKAEESLSLRTERSEIEPQFEQARARLEEARQKRSEAELALVRAESGREHQGALCREELGCEPQELLANSAELLEGELLQAAEEELREMKARIERLGPVNMMALEELQEAEERLTFLETQRQDLLASINDTNQTIREIDEVSHRKFMEAFNAINKSFAECFRTLFGGGSGEMRFADEADPESGIDIVAQPPGKRLQNVLLLSGGEKALTALALLVGVFRFSPSPFCILDEVDAPLDESNVVRFTRMIREMSEQTQFILVTHNKRTMEICPILYGVTMQEPGVSKLVSVRFESREAGKAMAVPA